MYIANEVIEYRSKHNLTQAQFAKIVGVSPATIWRLESGKSVLRVTEAKIKAAMEAKYE